MNELRAQMGMAAESLKADAAVAKERRRFASRRRLQAIVATKLRTAFIGAIGEFERFFGDLWGHGVPDSKKTTAQREAAEAWKRCRAAVLNGGNAQLRALDKEFPQYTVDWNMYQAVCKPPETRRDERSR